MTTAFFSLAYPGKDPGSASVHLKTCLLPEASLDAGSFTGWGAWFADAIMKTSIARCLRKTGGDSPCCTEYKRRHPRRPSGKSFWKGGARGGRTFFQKSFPLRKLFFLQISRRLPNKKSPAERGQKKTPSRCELQGGLRTIFGSGLLSHMTLCSIIGDGELNFRVRNGVGCTLSSMATKEIWQIY